MDTFYEPLLELEAFGQIREQLKKEEGLQLITGCVDSQKTHLMYSLGRDWPVKLILTYNELKAKEIYEEYEALGEDVYYYPARDFLFFQADIQGNELLRQRVTAVSRLLGEQKAVIITTLDGWRKVGDHYHLGWLYGPSAAVKKMAGIDGDYRGWKYSGDGCLWKKTCSDGL